MSQTSKGRINLATLRQKHDTEMSALKQRITLMIDERRKQKDQEE